MRRRPARAAGWANERRSASLHATSLTCPLGIAGSPRLAQASARGVVRAKRARLLVNLHRQFGYATVADPVCPEDWLTVLEAHDHIHPRGIDGLAHVGGRRVRVGVRVRVPHTDDLVAVRF